jgi:hypothetical protein
MAKLPLHADIQCFATLIRNAARQYLADITIPSRRAIRDGIKALYSAAKRYRYKETATRISKVPEQTRAFMKGRGDNLGLALPEPEAFRDCATRDEACETTVRLLRVGWEGDKPLLYTPKPPSHPPRREAELDFVTGLRLAYVHATGEPPAYTANPERPGLFARMVQACLDEIAPLAAPGKAKSPSEITCRCECAKLVPSGLSNLSRSPSP